jgi:hypothetical protein
MVKIVRIGCVIPEVLNDLPLFLTETGSSFDCYFIIDCCMEYNNSWAFGITLL